MSRRVLSLFMAFVFCFSILPTAAFAEGDAVTEPAGEGITAVDEVRAEDEGSTEETAAQPTEENDVSLFASEDDVAEVTIDGATTSYSDIMEAFAAAQATKTPAVIKLINDVSIGNRNVVLANDGDITFDLNGCVFSGTYSSADGRYNGLISLGASGVNAAITFTLTDTAGGGKIQNTTENSDTCVIYVSSTKARLKVEGGTIERSGDDGTFNGAAVIYTAFGNVEVYGGTLTGNVYGITVSASGSAFVSVSGDAKVYGRYAAINSLSDGIIELSGGTYSSGGSKPTFRTVSGTIGSLLKEGYTFISESGAKIDPATSATSFYEEVYVVEKVNPVAYIDENGNAAQCAEYTTLSGDPEDGKLVGGTNGEENWYVLTGQFRAEKNWTVSGNVNLILTDGSSCYAPEFSIKLEDKAVLKVYGQENSTGTLTAICGDEQTAALGGPAEKSYDPEYGITGDWTRGSLELYGGNINVTSSKYYAAFLRYLTVKGGTFTAKAPEDIAAISLQYGDSSLTLADDFKIVESNDPQRRISYANIAGIAVLMAKCTEHVWSYSASEDVGMHKATCDLCSTSREETHTYNLYGGTRDETKHNLKCVCGAVSEGTEAHDFACLPNSDTLTHGKACKVCGYRDLADDERHDFTADKTTCADCGFQRGVHLALGAEEFNYATLGEAIVKAAGDYAKPSSGGVITVCGGIEVFDARPTSINWGTFTIDFGGSNLKLGIGKSAFVIGTYADVTLKNGGLDLSGHMSYTTPGILVDAGKLTLENFTVTASCHSTPGKEHKQYPGITVKSYGVNPRGRLTIKDNVTLRGGFTVDGRYSEITRLTGGTFVCSCDLAVGNAPMIDLDGKKITDILADGYALAKADDANTLVPMYDENGDALSQIATDVQVVPHNHDLSHGKCGCGYLCTHENTDADGKCTACGAQIMAAKITWMDGETEQSALAENTDAAVQKVNALNESGKSDVTVTLLMDLDSEWVMKDSGTFMLTAADGVTLSKNITADGETDVTVAGGTYGGADAENPFAITAKNGGKIALKGGRFYGLQTGGDLPGIGGVMANGYALAKADDANTLVPMYDENGVFLSQIKADIQVVPHTHNTESGKCVCGYVCEHKNVDNSGKCTVCGAQVMTVKITWTDGGTEQSDFTKTTDAAVQKASELSGAGKSDVTVTLLADLDSEWVIKDGGTFKLTTADGVTLSQNITVSGNTDVTVIGGTYGSQSGNRFVITYQNGGKIALMGGGFYALDVIETGSVYAPGIASIMADRYAFYRKDAAGNEYLTDLGHASSFSLKGESDPAFIRPHTDHVFEWRQGRYGEEFYACGCGLEAVAFITTGENTVYYADLQEAINAAKGGDTIVLCGFTRLQEDIVIENNWDYNTPVTIDLNGRTVSFTDGSNTPNGHKMIVNDYAAVTIKGEGRITSLFAEPYAIICLYGGTYGRLEKRDGDGDGVLGYCAKGYGLKGSDGWITQYYSMAVSDVTVKKAPYEIKNIIATTDPAGTADAAAFYTEQKAYVKAALELESGEEAISDSNPVLCSVSVTPADGGSPAIEQIKCYSSDVSVEVILPDKSGDYVISVTVWHLGCEVKGDTKRITVSVCDHTSYTDGKCDTCGVACKHTDVSDAGHCGICGMDFNLLLTAANGSVSYYADVNAAFQDAGLAANKGCTLKLFKTVSDATVINPEYEKQTERAEFTFDLNGFDFGDWSGTLVLNKADMTLISSKLTGGYIGFYSMLRLDNDAVLKSPATESKLYISSINFPGQKTSTVSLGAGVYLANLLRPTSPSVLESGEMLEEGCVFRLNGGNGNIVPRGDSTTGIYGALVVRCPHEMENSACKYCGFVCEHKNYQDGKCTDCGTLCLHKNVDETTCICGTCEMQMAVKTEKKDGAISYGTDLSAAMNAAEDGETVTLLKNTVLSENGYVYGSGKTVTLDLNGFIVDINGEYAFHVGVTPENAPKAYGTLAIAGRGDVLPALNISESGTLDLSGWMGGKIECLSIEENSTVKGDIPREAQIGTMILTGFKKSEINEIALNGGSYGKIQWNNADGEIGLTLGSLLAPGYAFAQEDQFVLYTKTLNAADVSIANVRVVKCENHADADGDGKCDYCNVQLAASVESNGVKRVYTDLQEALDTADSGTYTVWLFADANGSYTVKKGSGTFKMNGKTVNEIVFEDDAKVALNDSGAANSVTFRGGSARFNGGGQRVTIHKLIIADGASWSSILPDADDYDDYGNRYGYKVYSDSTTFQWYDRDTIGDETSISNVKVMGLPVTGEPSLTLDHKPLTESGSVMIDKPYTFRFQANVTDGYGGGGVLFMQKEGEAVPTYTLKAAGDGFDYECDPWTFDRLKIGTYKVWTEVSKEGYVRRSKTYTLNVREKLLPTGKPTLDKTEITYGDEISSIGFSSDRLRDEENNVDVLGTFAWRDGSEKPSRAGDYEAEWIFTPSDAYDATYASVTGKVTIKVNKAAIPSGTITAPGVINNLVYKIDDDTPQVLHTTGDVENGFGTMKYTLGDPENADTVWSEKPITSRNAGEFTVYYKVFGDENHLDAAYGEISCSIAKYELKYSVVCSPKVYDGNDSGDPTKIDDVKFFNTEDPPKEITLRNDDYEIVSIRYKSKNVGGNLGTDDVEAEATITLKGDIAINYALAGGTACGRITPAPFEGISFDSYTYKICYTNTVPRSVFTTSFGAPDNLDCEIYPSTNLGDAKKDILSHMELNDNSFFTFIVKEELTGSDIGKKTTVKFKIYSKDHNYCTDELSFTVEIVDKASPRLTPDPVTMVYNGKAVPKELITGTATIDGYRIDGSWSWENEKAPTNVTENEEYTVVFTPRYENLYYSATAKAKVTVTPREIGDESISFAPVGSSYAYTGEPITPKAFGEYKYDKNEIARKLAEDTDYTVTYPADVANVGEKEITITGHGNFGGTRVLKYTITPCETTPTVTLSDTEYTYDGSEKRPAVTVKVNGKTLVEGIDFDVAYANNTDAEAGAKVTVTAKGNYGFAKMERFFHIQKADAAIDTAPAAKSLTYNGMSRYLVTDGIAKGGTFRYKLGDGDWTSSVPMARDAGKYTVWYCVIGDNNHKDLAAQSVEVNLEPKDIENAEIILFGNLTYNGETQTQELFGVRVDGLNVYTYDVANNTAKDAGDYVLTVKSSGNFKGEKTKMFTVARKTVTANVTVNGTYTYNKTPIEPTEVVVKDGETVISGDEYSLSFANNTEAGTATVTVSDKDGGNYAVSGTGTFTIDKATVPVRPNDITKVYGEEAVPTLWSDSSLIQESDLAEIAKTPGIFSSDGIAKMAPVVDGGYVLTVDPSQCETKNLIFRADGAATITVNKAPLTIKVKDVRREYGAENPPLEVEYSGFVSGEDERVLDGTLTLSYDNRIHAETAVGTYEKAAHAEGLSSGNYAINYLEGDVVIEKIAVTMTTGTARSTYLTVELDRPLAGLTAADFTVTDSEGQIVPISRVTASADQLKYSLTGNFAVGSMHTVTLNLDQTPYHLTHNIVNPTLSITPQRGGGGGSVSGLGGGGGTSAIGRYTVTFETNGGSRIEKQSVAKNTLLSEPSAPTKEGYAFAGWYTDKELKEKYDFSQTVTKNLTLYAAWIETEEDLSARQMILTIGEKEAMVFGERKTNDVAPQIVGDRTMLPARFVAENLGAIVAWNGETEVVTIRGKNLKDNTEVIIVIPIGSEIANVNGREYRLDSPAFVENDRTYTPIRFISEELSANVDWIESEQKVVITK